MTCLFVNFVITENENTQMFIFESLIIRENPFLHFLVKWNRNLLVNLRFHELTLTKVVIWTKSVLQTLQLNLTKLAVHGEIIWICVIHHQSLSLFSRKFIQDDMCKSLKFLTDHAKCMSKLDPFLRKWMT